MRIKRGEKNRCARRKSSEYTTCLRNNRYTVRCEGVRSGAYRGSWKPGQGQAAESKGIVGNGGGGEGNSATKSVFHRDNWWQCRGSKIRERLEAERPVKKLFRRQ